MSKFYDFKKLSEFVIQWAEDRELLTKGTPASQIRKTLEEVKETKQAIKNKDCEGTIDGIGDTLVTLIILCKLLGIRPEHCLSYAFNQIKNRTGKIVNGSFVKDNKC